MEQWRKNLYIVWFTQVLAIAGYGFMLPFIPYYIQELGVTEPEDLNLWVGLISSVPALSLAIMAPVWGYLADRYGHKMMLLRSSIAGVLIICAMSFSRNVETVFVLRFIQGIFSGSVTAAATLVASGTPKKDLSSSLGFLSSSTFIGYSLGPLFGGIAADALGYRASFFIGGIVLLVGFFLVLFFIKDEKAADDPVPANTGPGDTGHSAAGAGAGRAGGIAEATGGKPLPASGEKSFSMRIFLKQPFIMFFFILFFLRFARSFAPPFLPLYVQQFLGRLEGASSVTGIISALVGLASAVSGIVLGRLGDRYDKQRLIILYLGGATLVSLPLFWSPTLVIFTAFYILTAFALGGIEPLVQSFMSMRTPAGKRGVLFGLTTFVSSMGWFFSPLMGSKFSILYSIRHLFLFYCFSIFFMFFVMFVHSSIGSLPLRIRPRKRSP